MPRLNIAPTKSNYLSLKGQLAFAEEGYDLLEQKRQILIFELISRLNRVREVESDFTERLRLAHSALHEATLDRGGGPGPGCTGGKTGGRIEAVRSASDGSDPAPPDVSCGSLRSRFRRRWNICQHDGPGAA